MMLLPLQLGHARRHAGLARAHAAGVPGVRHAALQVPRQPPPDARSRTSASARTWASSTAASAPTAREVLETIPFERFSDDFVFDSQFLVSAVDAGFRHRARSPCRCATCRRRPASASSAACATASARWARCAAVSCLKRAGFRPRASSRTAAPPVGATPEAPSHTPGPRSTARALRLLLDPRAHGRAAGGVRAS